MILVDPPLIPRGGCHLLMMPKVPRREQEHHCRVGGEGRRQHQAVRVGEGALVRHPKGVVGEAPSPAQVPHADHHDGDDRLRGLPRLHNVRGGGRRGEISSLLVIILNSSPKNPHSASFRSPAAAISATALLPPPTSSSTARRTQPAFRRATAR